MSGIAPIEVGASLADGKLRYWRAKEAVRQGELRLASQATARTALEQRATAITGWAAAALLALAGFAVSQDAAPRGAVLVAAVLLFFAAVLGVRAARPRVWRVAGYNPTTTLNHPGGTELEILESAAVGSIPHILHNDGTLADMARHLRLAGWLLILGPIIGLAAYTLGQRPMIRGQAQNQLGRSSIGFGGGGGGCMAMGATYPFSSTASTASVPIRPYPAPLAPT